MKKNVRKLILFNLILFHVSIINAQKSVNITYIANEGFLIAGKTEAILIDGIFTQGWGYYHVPSTDVLTQERQALAPFNNVSHVLITHKDADHFKSDYLSEHLVNNTKAALICPTQVESLVKGNANYNSFKSRIIALTPTSGAKKDTLCGKIKFKVIPVPHEADASGSTQNNGYLFTLDGIKIFHSGDAVSDVAVFQNLNLVNDSIDIAFLPSWLFDSYVGKDLVKYLKLKAVVLMHNEISKINSLKTSMANMTDLPPVYIFDTQMKDLVYKIAASGVSDNKGSSGSNLRVFPNPSSGICNVTLWNESKQDSEIRVFDLTGKMILHLADVNTGFCTLNLTGYPKGVYFVKYPCAGEVRSEKIVLY